MREENPTPQPGDLEPLLRTKAFDALTDAEQALVLETLGSAEAYASMREMVLQLAQPYEAPLKASPERKDALMELFDADKPKRFQVWLNGLFAGLVLPERPLHRQPAFGLVLGAVLLLVGGWLVLRPTDEPVAFAEERITTEPIEKEPTDTQRAPATKSTDKESAPPAVSIPETKGEAASPPEMRATEMEIPPPMESTRLDLEDMVVEDMEWAAAESVGSASATAEFGDADVALPEEESMADIALEDASNPELSEKDDVAYSLPLDQLDSVMYRGDVTAVDDFAMNSAPTAQTIADVASAERMVQEEALGNSARDFDFEPAAAASENAVRYTDLFDVLYTAW